MPASHVHAPHDDGTRGLRPAGRPVPRTRTAGGTSSLLDRAGDAVPAGRSRPSSYTEPTRRIESDGQASGARSWHTMHRVPRGQSLQGPRSCRTAVSNARQMVRSLPSAIACTAYGAGTRGERSPASVLSSRQCPHAARWLMSSVCPRGRCRCVRPAPPGHPANRSRPPGSRRDLGPAVGGEVRLGGAVPCPATPGQGLAVGGPRVVGTSTEAAHRAAGGGGRDAGGSRSTDPRARSGPAAFRRPADLS
jgi:hypothetical protein